jgi:hypothetical protein
VDSLHITPGFVRVGPLGDLEGQVVEKQVGMDEGSNRGQLWLGRSMSESFDLFTKKEIPKIPFWISLLQEVFAALSLLNQS